MGELMRGPFVKAIPGASAIDIIGRSLLYEREFVVQ
jgi:hypothetical protein